MANFDAITYYKGLGVLRQLHGYLGEEVFVRGLRTYFSAHAFGNTELADLMTALGRAAGQDLAGWADAWLDHAGTDLLALEGGTVTVVPPADQPARRHRLDIGSYAETGELISITPVVMSDASVAVDLPPGAIHLLNVGDLTFAATRSDAASRAWLRDNAGRLPDTMSRTLAVGEAWGRVLRGESNGPEFIACITSILRVERNPSVVEPLLDRARAASEYWTHASLVADQQELIAAVALEIADDPENEVAALRALAACATTHEHFTRLEPAAQSNVDLAWRVLVRRSALAQDVDEEADALHAIDPDPDSWVSRLAVTAAAPSIPCKESAWRAVMVERTVPANEGQTLLMQAFWRPGQEALLQPYGERYLDLVRGLGGRGGMLNLSRLLGGMYPSLVGNDAFLSRAQCIIDDETVSALVRMRLAVASDQLRRQLAARRADRGQT